MDGLEALSKMVAELPDAMHDALVKATKEGVDKYSDLFAIQISSTMLRSANKPHGVLEPYIHTADMIRNKSEITKKGYYGFKLIYNNLGYRQVSWKTPNYKGVPYALIANVASYGHKAYIDNHGRYHKAASGNGFIRIAQSKLSGLSPEIYERFQRYMSENMEGKI